MSLQNKSPFFIWKEEYCSGNDAVDSQHKHLFKLGNELFYADYDSGRKYIMEFYKYTRYHFDSEEELMESVSYPGVEEHKKLHEQLISGLNDIADNYFANEKHFEEFKKFVYTWHTQHIVVEDSKILKN